MNRFLLPAGAALLCAALLLAPIVAAYPDDTTPQQPLWSSALSACVFLSAALCAAGAGLLPVSSGKRARPLPVPPRNGEGEGHITPTPLPLREGPGVGVLPGRGNGEGGFPFLLLLLWAGVSVLARLLTQHSLAFLGPMLRGFATWCVYGTAFVLCAFLSRQGKPYFFALLGTLLAASAWTASIGLSEYLQHVKVHEVSWRVFGTSTPDFLAAYLVLTVPVTLAALLRVPSGRELNSPLLGVALPGLAGLVLLTQAMTLLATGSRFALVSVGVGVGVFLLSLWAGRRQFALPRTARVRLTVLAVVVLLPALVVARPVLSRLSNLHDNSGAFRLWTWRGAVNMAAHNPVTGAGVGAWMDTYPRYALVGFTRLAHNSYLQMADECGVPGLLLLLWTLAMVVRGGVRSGPLPTPSLLPAAEALRVGAVGTGEGQERARSTVGEGQERARPARSEGEKRPSGRRGGEPAIPAPSPFPKGEGRGWGLLSDPLLRCGLLGAVAGGIVQNLIDSDWYVFFFGLTFWAMAGLLVGQGTGEARPVRPLPRVLLVGISVIGCAYFLAQTLAANYSAQGRTAENTQDAQTAFALAQAWDSLNARHHTDMASRVYGPVGNLPAAEAEIRQAVRLQPSAGNFLRLGRVLAAQGKTSAALSAYQSGLSADPNSVDLLLEAARLAPQSNVYYRRMAELETGPVGTVRAIGEIVEVKFAYADAALGLYARAARLLEAYAGEGGSANGERQAATGGQPNPAQDKELRALYVTVMDGLVRTSPPAIQQALAERRAQTLQLYDKLLAPPPNGVH